MRRRAVVLLIATLFWTKAPFSQADDAPNNRRPYLVSLIQLIANPNNFDGQQIRIVGVLEHNGVDRSVGVFVSSVDARNSVMPNSVDLRIKESTVKDLMGEYVVFSGTYHAPSPRAGYNGYFDQIIDLKPLNAREGVK
jgi:hypothetical protein